jgi:SAM-dependent methyltransferase
VPLAEWIPPDGARVLRRNGYAVLSELDDAGYQAVIGSMEGFQVEFLGLTRALWSADFPIPGDALSHFSRQWEYPYAWANLGDAPGRVLDAGSGITFFPFLLAAAGFEVDCCDGAEWLGLAERFERAGSLTGCRPRFTRCSLEQLPYAARAFDAVACISVLEHVASEREAVLGELARVLRPGGRLLLTCDVDLRRQDGLLVEDVSLILAQLHEHFRPAFPLDLRRPAGLLTSEVFLSAAPWRLPRPWRVPRAKQFRCLGILGLTLERRGA